VRVSSLGLALGSALIPLYGTLAALDPARPPIPPLIPHGAVVIVGVLAVVALAATVPAALRGARRDALSIAFLAPGLATIAAALPGFDPVAGTALGVLVLGLGGAAIALSYDVDGATTRLCLRAFLWSALAASLLALALLVVRRPPALYAYYNGRAVGTFLNPNELAAYALVGLGVALPLAAVSRGRDRLATATALALAAALGATFSRWGALSAVCGLAIYALAARARVLLAVAVAVAVAGLGLDAAAGARHHNPRDTQARIVAWRTGLTTFERFPLLGVGPLAFSRTYDVFRPPEAPGPRTPVAFDPHSLLLSFAAEGGIVAVVTLTASFIVVFGRVLRAARGAASTAARTFAFSIAAALAALMIDSGINTIILLFPLGMQIVPLALAAVRTDAL